jgi:hypothetical protein
MVQELLDRRWSPEQISQHLRRTFPDQPERHLVPETIYQAIYVQGRGEMRRELHRALRTGRAMRRPRRDTALACGRRDSLNWPQEDGSKWLRLCGGGVFVVTGRSDLAPPWRHAAMVVTA